MAAPVPDPGTTTTARLSPESFATLLEQHRGTLWVVAAAVLSDRVEAEDVVQEAALVAMNRLDSFTPGTSFGAWMSQIVRNIARNAARKEHRRQTSGVDHAVLDQLRPGTAGVGNAKNPLNAKGDLGSGADQFDHTVVEALRTLEETARVCLLLRSVGELSYAEISRIVDVPEGTAMSHVHRSRQTLRTRLSGMNPATGGVR